MTDLSTLNPAASGFTDPVRRLLMIGEALEVGPDQWTDYATEFGLDRAHVPELLRMATETALHRGDPKSPAVWAPIHAWRALGQLEIVEAVEPLLEFLKTLRGFDGVALEELPVAFGLIGPAAVPILAAFLASQVSPDWSMDVAASGLAEIASRHPPCRDDCLVPLVRLLEPDAPTDATGKGSVVSILLDLKAVETIEAIRQAFGRQAVDISIAGDLEDVEIGLGLRQQRSTPAPRYHALRMDLWGVRDGGRIREPVRATPRPAKIGRNDPCPCGSGKKYKKCCLP